MVQFGPATSVDIFKLASNNGVTDVSEIGLPMTFYSCDGETSTAVGNAGGSRDGFWTSSGPTWGWDMDADYERWFAGRGTVTVTGTFYLISSYYSFEGTSGWTSGSIGVLENDEWRWQSWTLSNAGSNRTRTVDVSITFNTSEVSALQIQGRGRMGKRLKCWSMVKIIKSFL